MAQIQTPYGYDVELDEATLPALISAADIATASGGRISATDDRLQGVSAAVSAAIRDYCGWHVAPSMVCTVSCEVGSRIIFLPAKFVSAISAVSYGDTPIEVSDIEWKRSGMIRMPKWPSGRGVWGAYEVTYTAGYDAGMTAVKAIATQIALNDLLVSPGVRSESVGQVSLSYNTTSGQAGGVSLSARDKQLLDAYKLRNRV